jgi:Na+/H+ antiporter NhaC
MPTGPPYGHNKTPSSQFTLTTYPGGSPYDTTVQLQRQGGLSFLLAFRRRRYCLIIAVVLFLLVYSLIYFSASSDKTVSLDTQFEVVDSATSNLAGQTTVFVTLPAQPTATQSHDDPSTNQQSEAVVFVLVVWSRHSAMEGALLIKVRSYLSTLFALGSPSVYVVVHSDVQHEPVGIPYHL